MNEQKAVGLGVAVIKSGEVVHLKAYGHRDLENKLEATTQTSFSIASVSKPIVCAAIFKLVEEGTIKLDNDINDYLPFKVNNPHFPNGTITISQLLNHRAGMNDGNGMKFWTYDGDSRINMTDFLRDYLTTSGKLYNKKTRFDTVSYRYSNIGYALLALIVEHTSRQSFEDFCEENIFAPLAMTHTSWFLKNLDVSQVAKTYTKKNKFTGFIGFPFYPCGQLRTSVSDYATFIRGYLSADSTFIVSQATRDLMTPKPGNKESKYYTWQLDSTFSNNTYYIHTGGLPGIRSWVLMDVTKRNAIILFANSETKLREIIAFIDKMMF